MPSPMNLRISPLRFSIGDCDGVEIIVEQLDHLVAGQLIGECGKPAQVGHHDHRAQALALGPADLPGEDASAGLRPEIGCRADWH